MLWSRYAASFFFLIFAISVSAEVNFETGTEKPAHPQAPGQESDISVSGPLLLPSGQRGDCESTREYVTTLEYLRKNKETLAMEDVAARKVADEVSLGCTGAAKRFIRAFEMLMKVEVGARTALNVGLKLSVKDDIYTDSFIGIFQRAYLKEFLDLDLNSSIRIAEALSADFNGEAKQAFVDFNKISDFCMKRKELNISLPHCARLSARISKRGEKFKRPMAAPFIEAFEYIHGSKKLGFTVVQSIKTAEDVVLTSPDAFKNFKYAIEYAMSEEGLKLSLKDALAFAQTMAARTIQLPVDEQKSPDRQPASDQKLKAK